jgi:hypothetical protein
LQDALREIEEQLQDKNQVIISLQRKYNENQLEIQSLANEVAKKTQEVNQLHE